MRVFLSGAMGSGKSTLGPRVAKRLGLTFVDVDERIEQRVGCSIREFFVAFGEAAFREVEASVIAELIKLPSVCLALGGGSVVCAATRRSLLRAGTLITLIADAKQLALRISGCNKRPLLDGTDPEARLADMLKTRRGVYSECHGQVDTSVSLNVSVDTICQIVRQQPLVVPLAERSYQVHVGADLRENIEVALSGKRVFIVGDKGAAKWVDDIASRCHVIGRIDLEGGEPCKHLESIAEVYDAALASGLDRQCVLLGIGGGAVGDLAGFAASTLLRGIPLVQVPTTLLSMVDSSVGGKTGFNRGGGKNLVGSFYQPQQVFCSMHTLSTLEDAEYRSGFAEIIKAAYLRGEDALAQLERDARDGFPQRDGGAIQRAIRMAVQLKADVVVEDERESGLRKTLNLGHTVGHVLESDAGLGPLRHGEAVGLGLIAACRVGASLSGELDQTQRVSKLLSAVGLPVDLDKRWPSTRRFKEWLLMDKKRLGEKIAFIVPLAPGRVEIRHLSVEDVMEMSKGTPKT